MARIVDKVREEENMGLSQSGTLEYRSGRMMALNPKVMEMPITNVFRLSILLLNNISIPEITIKLMAKIRMAPMIGLGMMEKMAVIFGEKAMNAKIAPAK